MRYLIVALIRVYQRWISPLFPAVCRYRPSCSHYTLQAVRKYGSIRGCWLGVLRILRCNPFSEGGWDPVPEQYDIFGRHHGKKPPDPYYESAEGAARRIGMLLCARTDWKSGKRLSSAKCRPETVTNLPTQNGGTLDCSN